MLLRRLVLLVCRRRVSGLTENLRQSLENAAFVQVLEGSYKVRRRSFQIDAQATSVGLTLIRGDRESVGRPVFVVEAIGCFLQRQFIVSSSDQRLIVMLITPHRGQYLESPAFEIEDWHSLLSYLVPPFCDRGCDCENDESSDVELDCEFLVNFLDELYTYAPSMAPH